LLAFKIIGIGGWILIDDFKTVERRGILCEKNGQKKSFRG